MHIQAIGFVLGVLASGIVWYVLAHVMIPKITFDEYIVRTDYQDKLRYTVRVWNYGRRDIIDVSPIVRYRVKGLLHERTHYKNVDLLLDGSKAVRLRKKSIGREPDSRGYWFYPVDTDEFSSVYFPESIRRKYISNQLTLEELMEIGEDAYIVVYVFCYDAWSGTRRLYTSKQYRREDIRNAAQG